MKKYAIILISILLIIVIATPIVLVTTADERTVIYIDPGHGGFDGGAVGDGNIYEKDLVLEIALKLASYFEKTGFKVYLTRKTDIALRETSRTTKQIDIYKRVELINKSKADLYISIHANSFTSSSIKGAQTFFNPTNPFNEKIAKEMQAMLKVLQPDNHRLAKSIKGKYLVDHVVVPGCLVEVGFLSNPAELNSLKTAEYQERIALMIYLGALSYFEKYGE